MSKRIVVLIALSLAAQATPGALNPEWSVTFSAESARLLLTQCSRRVPDRIDGVWSPDATVIKAVEAALAPALQTALDQAQAELKSPYKREVSEFYRQYGGVMIGGARIVYINGFVERYLRMPTLLKPPRPAIDWKHVAVNVCDGGSSFFGAEFDVTAGKIVAVDFNGRAFAAENDDHERPQALNGDVMIKAVSIAVTLAAVLVPSTSSFVHAQKLGHGPEPAAYRVRLCADMCTPESPTLATLVVVLFDDPTAALESTRSALASLPPFWPGFKPRAASNACFKVQQHEKRVGDEDLFVGLSANAATRWQYSDTAGFSVVIFQSPDATYSLRWAQAGILTKGEGWSAGPGGRVKDHRNAYFEAERTGLADVDVCK